MTETRIHHECVTARQRAWLDAAPPEGIEVFLSWCEPHVRTLYNRESGGVTYVPCLGGIGVDERQPDGDVEKVLAMAEAKRVEFEASRAKIVVPPWVLDTTLSASMEAQHTHNYVLKEIVDVRSLFITADQPVLEMDGSTVAAWLAERFLDKAITPNPSLAPLWDALNEYLRESVTKFFEPKAARKVVIRDHDEEDEDDAFEDEDFGGSPREQEQELSTEILLAWQQKGLFGYVVQFSSPVRTYHKAKGKKDATTSSYSWGYASLGWAYLESLEDRSAIVAELAQWDAAARAAAK